MKIHTLWCTCSDMGEFGPMEVSSDTIRGAAVKFAQMVADIPEIGRQPMKVALRNADGDHYIVNMISGESRFFLAVRFPSLRIRPTMTRKRILSWESSMAMWRTLGAATTPTSARSRSVACVVSFPSFASLFFLLRTP
jgi:hypothetical protein